MIDLLFLDADDLLSKPGVAIRVLDPGCGTGGMLSGAQTCMRDHHADAKPYVCGQDHNKRAFATVASDILMKEVDQNGAARRFNFATAFQRQS